MYYKYVTFCGHRDLPDRAAVEAWLRRTLPCLYAQGARRTRRSRSCSFAPTWMPYLDAGPAPQPGMASVYPPLERVPRRFAIARRNRWMVDQADVVVACVQRSWGGAAEMLRYAQRRGKAVLSSPPMQIVR